MQADGTAKPSYATSLLQQLAAAPGSAEEAHIRDTAAVAFGGACLSYRDMTPIN